MFKFAVITKNWFIFLPLLIILAVFSGSIVNAQSAPEPTKPGSSLKQRVAQRKAERKIKLDERTTKRLEDSCVRAQTKLRQVRDEYVSIFDKRSEIYRKVDAKLWVAIGSLKYVNKDTFKLEQQRAEFVRQVNGFESTAGEFRQTLDDMVSINCAADVVGFKAFVETARLYNTQIRTRSNGITDHVVNEVKPLLTGHASELRPRASQE
ncbi:hypothetical protein KY385_03745 [Candidatus Parcubacteria bacterium]|nr:hypothetical protein [Candidatus Parcubacteria bacterium]